VRAGQQFTDTAVRARSDLDQYEVLHFATHGLSEGMWGCPASPPALVTSFGDANSDGLLSFDEIAALRLDANLVVLSACETASGVKSEALARRSGQEEAGSTLEGLVRAFLTANSRAVLATHWEVSAEAETDDLVRAFYSAARGSPIGSALQTAQRALSAQPEYSHPFYWGAYFVVGDSSKMMLRRSPSTQTASR
jgi:CHAT domain-containing protein